MLPSVAIDIERWPLKKAFRISRGSKTEAEVVLVTIRQGTEIGRGEACPSARYGESAERVARQIEEVIPLLQTGMTREQLQRIMPPGSARCAVDCALWDLEAAVEGRRDRPSDAAIELVSSFSIGIDSPERMAEAARNLSGARLIKVKLDSEECQARIRMVRAAAPGAKMIVDANESWSLEQLAALQPLLAELDIAFIEQPLPAGSDADLAGFPRLVPICADESCHVTDDLAWLRERYDLVNIKLDKTGGLTEALKLHAEARRLGLGTMVGCMVGTSLSIAPALRVARISDVADLDGPWLLATDRAGGLSFSKEGYIRPPARGFWGPAL